MTYKKQVFKRLKGAVECLYEGYLEADVSYSNDISSIKGLMDLSADTKSINLSQLLAGFFSFYLNIFNPD